ncbi:helix-turn-helix domain-containing protein [Bartonella sp. 220]|uniref:helix-turn-helix domain-containing protein n=1 Tax=Bartonella sp. 220B TaxID=2967260 RepID=UPI0022A9BBDA|nr:helix-turn-helix transcriptional regulator [Bartonella sp. 220B]MCZ2157982.1 helix-turn-helix domain-containing protein [Bartonella sp. 220B]
MQTKNLFHDILIGKKIRFKRRMLKISQKALGQSLNLSAQQIQKYETGLNRASAGRLNEIANILNVPLSFFYTDILTKQQPPYPHDEIISSKEEYLLLKSFRVLNSVKQKAILQLISDQKENV